MVFFTVKLKIFFFSLPWQLFLLLQWLQLIRCQAAIIPAQKSLHMSLSFNFVCVWGSRIGLDVLSVSVISDFIKAVVIRSILYFFRCSYHI